MKVGICVLSALGVLVSTPVFAGCIEDTKVEEFAVTFDLDPNCIVVDVQGNECTGGLNVVLTNNCEYDIVVTTPRCIETEDVSCDVTIVQMATRSISVDRDGPTTTHFISIQADDADLTLQLVITATADDPYSEGCSSGGMETVVPMAFIGLCGFVRRRRTSHSTI